MPGVWLGAVSAPGPSDRANDERAREALWVLCVRSRILREECVQLRAQSRVERQRARGTRAAVQAVYRKVRWCRRTTRPLPRLVPATAPSA